MDGLREYIGWLGDLSFKTRPFGDVDALILSLISYFDLAPAEEAAAGKEVFIKDCLPFIEAGQLGVKISGGDMGNTAVFKAAAESLRFGELRIERFTDQLDPKSDLQFSAVTFKGEGFGFIAFRGTDSTLVGWKEDFMIGYTHTEAQKLALEYAERAMSGCEGPGSWYIGGHSKGGNLALYAACMLPDELLSKLTRVYDLDGPGFPPDVVSGELIARVDPKVTKIIPEYCVVGRLMEVPITDTRIIKSQQSGVLQHSLASWGVEFGRLALSELEKPQDLIINDTLRQWIDGLSYQERVSFINEFFDALMASGADTVDELFSGGVDELRAVLSRMKSFSGSAKNAVSGLQEAAADTIVKRLQDLIPEAVVDTTKDALDSAKTVLPRLQAAAERIVQRGERDQEEKA